MNVRGTRGVQGGKPPSPPLHSPVGREPKPARFRPLDRSPCRSISPSTRFIGEMRFARGMEARRLLERSISILLIAAIVGCGPAAPPGSSPPADEAHGPAESQGRAQEPAVPAGEAAPRPVASDQWQASIQAVLAGQSERIHSDLHVTTEQMRRLSAATPPVTELLLDGGVDLPGALAIATLTGLEHLRIRQTPVDDSFCRLVAESLPALRILNVPQGRITADGIAWLSRLDALVQLRLGGEQLDDRAAQAIASLPRLQSLHLIGPSLSPRGLKALAAAPNLSSLYIDDCPLPDEAWEELFRKKPGLHVHIDQQHHDRDPQRHSH